MGRPAHPLLTGAETFDAMNSIPTTEGLAGRPEVPPAVWGSACGCHRTERPLGAAQADFKTVVTKQDNRPALWRANIRHDSSHRPGRIGHLRAPQDFCEHSF
jgi:hypothetical protein